MAVRARTLRDLIRLWQTVEPQDFNATFAVLVEPIRLLIDRDRPTSAGLASDYYRRLRMASRTFGTMPEIALPGPIDMAVLSESLAVTGPVARGKALRAGKTPAEAARRALVATSGSVSRHVLNAGRQTIADTMQADRANPRWRRVTSGQPCDFCTMLSRRGAVYSETTVEFRAHDHCACMPAPAF